MRILSHVSVIVAALSLAGCGSASDISDRIAGHRASPFSLFGRDDMRAGLRFDILREAAKKESVKQFECMPLWFKAQRCSLAIESGMLTAIVDSTGRVIRLLAATDPIVRNGINVHGQMIYRDVIRDTRASWDSVGPVRRDDGDPAAPQLRWLDRSQRWSGSLWYSRLHRADVPRSSGAATDAELAMTVPESIGVTDMPAYALFLQRRPSAAPTVQLAIPPRTTPPRPPTAEEVLAMMRSDLRAVTIAQEAAVHATGNYHVTLDSLHLTRSDGVEVELLNPTPEGWSALASHPRFPGMTCVVFAGYVGERPATIRDARRAPAGEIACDRPF